MAVGDVHHLNFLIIENSRFFHQVFVDGDAAYIIEVGIGWVIGNCNIWIFIAGIIN